MNNKTRLFELMAKINNINEGSLHKNGKVDIINDFIKYVESELKLKSLPKLTLIEKNGAASEMRSFGGYDPNNMEIVSVISNRNTADILRTIAHELVHHKQNIEDKLNPDSGKTGSDEENEANAMAGILMRNYGKLNPQIFE